MQLHTCTHVLICLHACVNMCLITSDGEVFVSLTYCASMLHEELHTYTHTCYLSGYIHTCANPTCMYVW